MMNLIPFAERRRFYLIGKKEVALLGWFFAGRRFFSWTGPATSRRAQSGRRRSAQRPVAHHLPGRHADARRRSGPVQVRRGLSRPALNKKIIPVTIRGAFDIMPPGKALPRFTGGREMELVVGAPVDPKDFASIEALTEHLRNVIAGQT
jgi:hypothetical protein